MTILRIINFVLLFLLFQNPITAQESGAALIEMITDRPDQTEAPSVVPMGYLQIETGAAFEENGKNPEQITTTFNTTLLRYGIFNNWELRLGWDFSEVETRFGGQSLQDLKSGLSPLLIGTKINIAREDGLLPEIGLLGHIYAPFSASNDFKTATTGVDFRFSMAHTLSSKSSISYNLGMAWGDDSPEASYIYTLSFGHSLTGNMAMYIELYGNLPENSRAQHLWNAGLTYLLRHNMQLDATIGSGITEGQTIMASAGISVRIPR